MREKIAEECSPRRLDGCYCPECCLFRADRILALQVAGVPLSELIEKAESGKLVELDEMLPLLDWPSHMAKRGYRKVKPLASGESR